MSVYLINDNSPEAIEYRGNLMIKKKADVLQRLNEELRQSPFKDCLQFTEIGLLRNGFTGGWNIHYIVESKREFTVELFATSYTIFDRHPTNREFRTTNRVQSYYQCLATMLIKYAEELDKFRKSMTFG